MARATTQEEESLFEEEVLRVARAIFAKDRPYQGSIMLDNRERDGVFIGEDSIAIVEATVSRGTEKAEKDGKKLQQAVDRFSKEHQFKAVKGYFVTKDEPTADQRATVARLKSNIATLSFAQLRSLLVDAGEYLNLRNEYPFGSARNPATGSATDLDEYIHLGFVNASNNKRVLSEASDLPTFLTEGQAVVITGDFGAGKSMTVRHVHQKLANAFLTKRHTRFPITLNLRDHQGQKDADEAIRRHATKIGFDSPAKLVRAWRAGDVDVLLDGFDEIATTGWLGQANNLRQIRRRSVELVRKIVEETPTGVGLLLAGRRHLFDSQTEMLSAFNLSQRKPSIFTTDEFSEAQIQKYLTRLGWESSLPEWIPARPLLLGYLATSGALSSFADPSPMNETTAAEGWDALLTRICQRESAMEVGVDADQIRRVLERLATLARTRNDGIGPIFQEDFSRAFNDVCGYSPDEGSYMLLQRLPGLGVTNPTDGSRYFIDETLADVARAGDLVRYVQYPDYEKSMEGVTGSAVSLGAIGMGVAHFNAAQLSVTGPQALATAERLQKRGASDSVAFDSVRLAMNLDLTVSPKLSFKNLQLERMIFGDAEGDLSALHLDGCLIDTLDLTEFDGDHDLPVFSDCMFGTVLGAGSASVLPSGHFNDCHFESFDASSKTTRGILATVSLSPRQRVALTILKKIYLQGGAGRRDSALVRGLDDKLRGVVPEVTQALLNSDLVAVGRMGARTVYYPIRGLTPRVRTMIEQGAASGDAVLNSLR